MKIVIVSLNFLPNTGGLENVIAGLAEQWHNQGNDVVVLTKTPGEIDDYGYKVQRQFSIWELLKKIKEADIFLEANISLKTVFAGLMYKKKWVVVHQVFYQHNNGILGVVKNFLTRFSHNITPSKYMAESIKSDSVVIHNFFSPIFKRYSDIKKTEDLIFVGRLVSDKGVNDLISSLRILQGKSIKLTCSIVGDGPERQALQEQVIKYGLENSVFFKGIIKGEELVKEINKHKIIVIPSRWNEPFGLVALEGLACGCKVVCSSGGGLPEAAGSFGVFFANGDVEGLANAINKAFDQYEYTLDEQTEIKKYLKANTANSAAEKYLQYFRNRIIKS